MSINSLGSVGERIKKRDGNSIGFLPNQGFESLRKHRLVELADFLSISGDSSWGLNCHLKRG